MGTPTSQPAERSAVDRTLLTNGTLLHQQRAGCCDAAGLTAAQPGGAQPIALACCPPDCCDESCYDTCCGGLI